jgi:ferredoxin--NADP+ reductase
MEKMMQNTNCTMPETNRFDDKVAIIGAGPAGLFAARTLAANGVQVALINRDIKPGGLAEYGIYPAKHKMKEPIRAQFRQILEMPEIQYFGNLTVGENEAVTLKDILGFGFDAILVTSGAQANKWLGLPGEDLPGVYHSKDIVYAYNGLPPFSTMPLRIGRRVALVGVGNVMLDVARWLIDIKQVDEVTAVARRGPAEVKFDRKELEYVAACMDFDALQKEIDRVSPVMQSVGQDPAAAMDLYRSALDKALPHESSTRFSLRFLSMPTRVPGDANTGVTGLEVEDTILVREGEDTKAKGTGIKHTMDVDTVIFAIGDKVDAGLGLPIQWGGYACKDDPKYPVEGISYEVCDSETGAFNEGIFAAGWSRQPSKGLVGTARREGTNAASAILNYLDDHPVKGMKTIEEFKQFLLSKGKPLILKEDLAVLKKVEDAKAVELGLEEFKFRTNEEMLKIIGK